MGMGVIVGECWQGVLVMRVMAGCMCVYGVKWSGVRQVAGMQ